ncbi:hypothetical protein Patl1_09631 [Pistacia atlantica]|uniref:Uncharacterized protein n=1 Tax=Pistacia atlantica TaxID=434234 RepID=A0ACC1A8C0_9ROSI|nr:hypothetical protein Patl1_09631 [Pistacia atlantica]
MHFLREYAFPKLRHLTFGVTVGAGSESLVGLLGCIQHSRRKKVETFPKCSHGHLKVVDLETAFYLFENATLLHKMIVQIISPYIPGADFDMGSKQGAREGTKKLEKHVPDQLGTNASCVAILIISPWMKTNSFIYATSRSYPNSPFITN